MKKRILFVEDDLTIRDLYPGILSSRGYSVEAAADGRDALEIYDRDPDFFAVVTDNRMPALSGIELGEILRNERNYRGRLILMTGTPGDLKEEQRHYFDAILEKPFISDDLIRLLESQ